jgi:C-terminal processing protease CtpA/Prc
VEDKIYGLSTVWQEVNYNFVFLDRLEFDFDSLYKAYIPRVISAKDNFEYIHTLRRFMNHLNDGHTGIMFSQFYWNTGDYPPVFLKMENDKFYVEEILMAYSNEIPPGSELISADGIPYAAYKTKSPSGNLFGYLNSTVNLEFKTPDGTIVNKDFTRNFNTLYRTENPPEMVTADSSNNDDWTEFNYEIKNNLSVVQINTFQNESIVNQFKNLIAQINESKGLILDVRANGGGNGAYAQEIAKHLMSKDHMMTMSWKTRIHNAAKKAWKEENYIDNTAWEVHNADTVKIDKSLPRIEVPVVILTSERTFSAAEDFLIYSMSNQKIKRIGSNSAGSSGQPLFIDLPGGISARICAKRDALPDGTDYIGTGIEPDIRINEHEDALTVAIEYLNGT